MPRLMHFRRKGGGGEGRERGREDEEEEEEKEEEDHLLSYYRSVWDKNISLMV